MSQFTKKKILISYMLIYGICYYYGTNKKKNIYEHLKCFNNIKKPDDVFCLNIMIDSRNNELYEKIEKEFTKIFKKKNIENFKILIDFNSGGTILGLYNTFNYFKNKNKTDYIAFFEEDFNSINKNWLIDSINLLNNNNYIYIGEHIPSTGSKIDSNYLYFKKCKVDTMDKKNCWKLSFSNYLQNHNCEILNNELCWTDGGYYFSSIENFNKIYNKIGIFHKGNKKTIYNHEIVGIILGEVGFPSQINKYFNFIGLLRSNYFTHE